MFRYVGYFDLSKAVGTRGEALIDGRIHSENRPTLAMAQGPISCCQRSLLTRTERHLLLPSVSRVKLVALLSPRLWAFEQHAKRR